MQTIVAIAIGFVLLLNMIVVIWSVKSLKNLLRDWQRRAPSDNFLMEHLVDTKSSIRLIYAWITLVAIALTLFGWDQVEQIKEDVKTDILKTAQVSLDTARSNVHEIDSILSLSRVKYDQMDTLYKVAKAKQKLFIVRRFTIPRGESVYAYARLPTINGIPIPKFAQAPAAVWRAYPDNEQVTTWAVRVTVTKDNVQFHDVDIDSLFVDLWIYGGDK